MNHCAIHVCLASSLVHVFSRQLDPNRILRVVLEVLMVLMVLKVRSIEGIFQSPATTCRHWLNRIQVSVGRSQIQLPFISLRGSIPTFLNKTFSVYKISSQSLTHPLKTAFTTDPFAMATLHCKSSSHPAAFGPSIMPHLSCITSCSPLASMLIFSMLDFHPSIKSPT